MNVSKFSVLVPKIISLSSHYCTRECYFGPPKHVIATIVGGATPVGKMASLLLKQNPYIDELRLCCNSEDVCGVALDLSHIDTNTKVKAYYGRKVLPEGIQDAHIILVCAGTQRTSVEETQLDLFEKNAPIIRTVATYAAEFNPKAVFCIATPPINSLVPLVSEEYKKAKVYDPRKIIGVTTLATCRTNVFISNALDANADNVTCPVIGGFSPQSVVPVLSQATPCQVPYCDHKEIQENVRFAEEDALCLYKHEHGLVLSAAFGIARFATALAKAIKGDNKSFVCCYVRQTGHIGDFLKYMTSIVKLGEHGADATYMPQISGQECAELQEAAEHIRQSIKLGEGYVTGEILDVREMETNLEKSCDLINVKKPEEKGKNETPTKKENEAEKEEPKVSHRVYAK